MVAAAAPRGWFEPAGPEGARPEGGPAPVVTPAVVRQDVPQAAVVRPEVVRYEVVGYEAVRGLPTQGGPPPVSGGLTLEPDVPAAPAEPAEPAAPAPVVLDAALLRDGDIDALLAEALTARPNEVVLDLTGPDAAGVPRHRVRRALQALAPWPHPPVLVALEPPHGLPLQTPDPGLGIDLVTGTSLAAAIVTARRWVDAASLTMRPPVVSRALALGHVVGFLEHVGSAVAVEDAVECTDVLLRWALAGGAVRVDVRLAADGDRLGIAMRWRPDGARPDARRLDDERLDDERLDERADRRVGFAVPLLATLVGTGAHRLGADRLGWVALRPPTLGVMRDAG